jgi:hypothetical protein
MERIIQYVKDRAKGFDDYITTTYLVGGRSATRGTPRCS